MYSIDPDITRAHTLPGQAYSDPQWYARQLEFLFPPSWQYIPLSRSLQSTHDQGPDTAPNLYPFQLLPGSLDEPLLLSRDGHWRCLSNVCTHRGALLQEQAACQKILQCPYHGRSFDLQGRFKGMPAFESAENFPAESDHLPQLALQQLGPWFFTALETPVYDFEAWLGPLKQYMGFMNWDDFVLHPQLSRDYVLDANWMLYCENYLEGLHIPYVHPALNALLDFKAYEVRLFDWGSLQIGLADAKDEAADLFDLPRDHPDAGRPISAYYFWFFPNLMLNFYPWGLSLNLVEPQGVERCRVRYQSWVYDASRLQLGAGGDTDQTELEDQQIVRSVARGVRSRLYMRGRYSPSTEQGVHHFHRLLTRDHFSAKSPGIWL